MKRTLLVLSLLLLAAATAAAALQEETVDYAAGGTILKGYLAYDDSIQGKRPGILVVHEWWGQNAYARKRARILAELGYTALALDMYGEGKEAFHPEDAGRFSGELRNNLPLARERFLAGMELLRAQPTVDGGRIAAIGYCFGGGIVLEMARDGVDLAGVASFHGSLATDHPARPGVVTARILVANGAADTFVTAEEIAVFKKEMDAAGVRYHFVDYPGARHSFTNPDADELGRRFTLPLAYSPEADRLSWEALQDFFREIFILGTDSP